MERAGIRVRDLYLRFTWQNNVKDVFNGLEVTIPKGEFITICGDNASGKTSFLKLLTGLQAPGSGEIWINGVPIHTRGVNGARKAGVGYLAQNPVLQILGSTVREELDYVVNANPDEKLAVAHRFGLEDRLQVRPQALSGGERQRLALAVLMLQKSPILLLDEPSSYLDAGQTEILRDDLHLLHQTGRTIIHVTQFPAEATWGTQTYQLIGGRLKAE